ncbi:MULTISPECIES: ABC transporter substrate-binding protein [unclassified Frankia]|uniref:ABC transporter substrate-binding protein n=1 Tax=unclassified Frankia TaxID=2632575 RepID=UPI0006CA001C|nr:MULTISPECIES: ABC transporter substrate-binding protein [unclassified Frankia]
MACNTPGIDGTKIKIGLVYPDTGLLSTAFRDARSGAEARIRAANEAGGVNGRTVEYVLRDDHSDAASNDKAVRDLVGNEKVFGLMETTAVASGGAQYLSKESIPTTGIAAERVWSENKNMFAASDSFAESSALGVFGRYVRSLGGTKAATINVETVTAAADISRQLENALRDAGIAVLPQPFIYNQETVSPQYIARQIRESGADVVIGGMGADQSATVLPAVRAGGAQIRAVIIPGGNDPAYLLRYGTSLSGVSTFVQYIPFEIGGAAHSKYLEAMARFAPEIDSPKSGAALGGYVQADLFLRGLEISGSCPTRESFVTRLSATKDYTAGGLLPGPADLSDSPDIVTRCIAILRVDSAGTGFELVRDPAATPDNPHAWCTTQPQ